MCNISNGEILIVTDVCSLICENSLDIRFVMLGTHYGDVQLLYPGDVCLVIKHFVGELRGFGYRNRSHIFEYDAVVPTKVSNGGNMHGYLILVKNKLAYVNEHYLEKDAWGYQEMSCLMRINEHDT